MFFRFGHGRVVVLRVVYTCSGADYIGLYSRAAREIPGMADERRRCRERGRENAKGARREKRKKKDA